MQVEGCAGGLNAIMTECRGRPWWVRNCPVNEREKREAENMVRLVEEIFQFLADSIP